MVREHGLEAAQLYFADAWGPKQIAIVRGLHIRYLYVDRRIAHSLPKDGFYFYPGEAVKPTRVTVEDLTKFAQVRGLKVVYQHGPVTIYDTVGLGVKPLPEGFTGERPMGLGALGDALWGALTAIVIFLLRRRLAWIRSVATDLRPLGIALSVVAATLLVGLALFGLRLIPGPTFTVGAVSAAVVIFLIKRTWRANLSSQMLLRRKPDPLVCLGLLIAAFGLAISLHAAWASDESAVNAILRAVNATRS